MHRAILILGLLWPLLLLITGCGSGGGSSVSSNSDLETGSLDESGALFEPDRLLRIDIEMDPDDYDILRAEGRSLPLLLSGCYAGYEYSHFSSTVTIDGKRLNNVDIRKKGFFGSLSATRPSFKLNLDALQPGQEYQSQESLTLNNNRQDPGNTHQCMSYEMFRQAGLPAPRCNFARVTMNGEDLGIYSNVESIDRRFLRRHFGDGDGNLYEGQLDGDFGNNTQHNFQQKNNEDSNDRSDLAAVANALDADDANLPGLLGQVVAVDQFITYWAMESITGHWDSATGNSNNYFVYHNPQDGRFYYLPWGTDAALQLDTDTQLLPYNGPLFRYIEIPARLYAIPAYREKFHQRVEQLLEQLWDEPAFNREIDRIRDLTSTPEQELVQVRAFFAQYEEKLRASISGEFEQLERRIVDETTVCSEPVVTSISGSFADGAGSFEYIDAAGEVITAAAVVSAPDDDNNIPLGGGLSISMAGLTSAGFNIVLLNFEEQDELEVPFSGLGSSLILVGPDARGNFGLIGMGGAGGLVFDAKPVRGEPASGRFSAELYLLDGSELGGFGGAP